MWSAGSNVLYLSSIYGPKEDVLNICICFGIQRAINVTKNNGLTISKLLPFTKRLT